MTKDTSRIILFLILGFQAVALIFLNLTQLPYHLGHDTTVYIFQTIASWQQKKLLLDDWMYQTTFGLDSPVPLAALLYGIFRDVFIAYGLANIILTGAFSFVLMKLMKRFELSLETKLVLLNLALGLHFANYYMVFNSLEYGSVMFIDNGAYIIKTIIALLVLICSIDLMNGKAGKAYLTVTAVLVMVSCISSGFWILVTSVLPIIVWRVGDIAREKSFKPFKTDKTLHYSILLAVLSVVGQFLMVVIFHHPTIDSAMKMITLQDFWNNVGNVFMGYFEVAGALGAKNGQLLSIEGIAMVTLFIVACTALFSLIYVMRDKELLSDRAVQVVMATVIENFILFFICSAKWGALVYEVRYLILIYLISLITMGLLFERKIYKIYSRDALIILASLGILITFASSVIVYMRDNDRARVDRCNAFIAAVDSTDAKIVYSFGEEVFCDSRDMRCFDTDHVYKSVVNTGAGHLIYHFGDSSYLDHPGDYNGPVVFIYHDDDEAQYIPDHILEEGTEILEYNGCHVLYLEHNVDDFYADYII